MTAVRERRDRCPGALRPWPAADGLLVRLRLIGGHVTAGQLRSLSEVAQRFGDGRVYVTSRANLQVRAFPGADGHLDPAALDALESTGLLPTRSHELVRNVMISPQTGSVSGRANLRPVGQELDRLLCVDGALTGLPGRFLFVLDDGRGDLLGRTCDLGLVALDAETAQLRVGAHWGAVVGLRDAASALVDLATCFLCARRESMAWHVSELDAPLVDPVPADSRLPAATAPLPYGEVPGGRHVQVPEAGLTSGLIADLTAAIDHVIVTPWRGVYVAKEAS